MPLRRAASSLPPTAYIYRPIKVLLRKSPLTKTNVNITITGTGTGPAYPCPRNKKALCSCGIVTDQPCVIQYIRPRPMLMVPNVAMNGGSRRPVIIKPLASPTSSPLRSPARTARATGWPPWISSAVTSPARPMVEPTARSIPPVRITIVSPIAMIATNEKARITLKRLAVVRNTSEPTDRIADSMITAITTLNSRKPVIRFSAAPTQSGRVSFATSLVVLIFKIPPR